ncbi:hypothetical protein HDU81_011438 [Chytriomyces hyalinus]|nr:hypothetical protein HDU81_011438 [Chytriomyces hyalinus]
MFSPMVSSLSTSNNAAAFKCKDAFDTAMPADPKGFFDSMHPDAFATLLEYASTYGMDMGMHMPTDASSLGLGLDLTEAEIDQLLSPTSPLAPLGHMAHPLMHMELAPDVEMLLDPQSDFNVFRRASCASLVSANSIDTSPFSFQPSQHDCFPEDLNDILLGSPMVPQNPYGMLECTLLSPVTLGSESHFFAPVPLSPSFTLASPTREQAVGQLMTFSDMATEFTTLSPKAEVEDTDDVIIATKVAETTTTLVKPPPKKRTKKIEAPSPCSSFEDSGEEASDFEMTTRRASIHTSQPTPPSSFQGTVKRERSYSTSSSPVGLAATSRNVSTGAKVFHCPYDGCDKTFPRQYNLKSHMFCHSGLRPHVCEMCNSAFARKHDLQRHVRTLHATDRPFKCTDCSQSFTQSDQLRRHQIQEKQSLAYGAHSSEMHKRKSSDLSDEE